MATKIIKAWIDGAIQEIEVEDIISPEQPLSVEERVETLEGKHDVIITEGNMLVGNGTNEMEEMTPSEVLSHINGLTALTLTKEEHDALGDSIDANTFYMITDGDEEVLITVEDIDAICGSTISYVNLNEGAF